MLRLKAFGLAAAMAVLLSPAAARAAWVKAETERFVVYGDVGEAVVRDYAVRLSTFDQVLHLFNPRARNEAPPRKFSVYLLRQNSAIQRIVPSMEHDVAGFYAAESQADFAVASLGARTGGNDTVLFHEYAHHFMFANFAAPYPGWFVEGWAEYFGNTKVTPENVSVGNYNPDRVVWLGLARWVPWEDFFNKRFRALTDEQQIVYYPQAWLFVHYMMSAPARAEQLNKITRAIADGQEPAKTVWAITGMSQAQLTRELLGYSRLQINILKDFHPKTEVTVSQLPASADDMLLDGLRLATSDIDTPDAKFLADVRKRAAKYPGDALAEQVLALAEFTFGDVAAGETILRRRLQAMPDEVETLRIAGVGQILAGERNRASAQARFRAARPLLIKAYSLDKSDFRTLYAYAFSRTLEPDFPNENDLNALLEAHGLAPSAEDISLLAGEALRRRGHDGDGKALLAMVANNPHGGDTAERARALTTGGQPLALESLQLVDNPGARPKPPKGDDPKAKPGS